MLKINTRELVSDSISYFNVRNVPLALLRLIQWTYSFLKYLITSSILRIVRLIFGVLSIFFKRKYCNGGVITSVWCFIQQ